MSNDVKRVVTPKGLVTYEIAVDDQTKVIFIDRADAPPLSIGFICAGSWYYQSLMWSCRGGKFKYFRAMAALYRYLRRNNLTENSLRYLAWGENRMKNGGFAIRSTRSKTPQGEMLLS